MIILPVAGDSAHLQSHMNQDTTSITSFDNLEITQELDHPIFTIGLWEFEFNLDDPANTAEAGYYLRSMIYDRLIQFNSETGQYDPILASDWYMSANGRQWTFRLKEGVTFHDSTPFNALALKFNFDRIINPSNPGYPNPFPEIGAAIVLQSLIEDIIILSEYELTIRLTKGYAPFLSALTDWSIISPGSYENGDFIYPYGTGPYAYTRSRETENVTVLIRNNDYFQGVAPFEEIHFLHLAHYENRSIFCSKDLNFLMVT